MINPNLTLKEKALAGAIFLRKYAEALADTKNPMLRISAESRRIAADAIEQIVEENEKLHAQLVAFQKAANPAVAVDPAIGPDTTARQVLRAKGARVFLKSPPYQHGTVAHVRVDAPNRLLCFVCFDSEFEKDRWMDAKHLESIPDE
ncbi:hypothetical protein NFE68_003381 [Salmonella enterica]|nr:hypothetical protein [Salmonella enterica]